MIRRHFFVVCLTLILVVSTGRAQQVEHLPEEFSLIFNEKPNPVLQRIGADADKSVRFEREGLRITLPAGFPKESPNTGVQANLVVKGDFEITVSYEVLKEPDAKDTDKQTRFTILLPLGPGHRAALSRRVAPVDGRQFLTFLLDKSNGKKGRSDATPTKATSGRLRMVRQADTLSYYASEGLDGELVLLQRYPFSNEDVKDVRIVGSTGGPKAFLDIRVLDFRIRAESLPNLPAPVAATGTQHRSVMLLLGFLITVVVVAALLTLRRWLQRRRA